MSMLSSFHKRIFLVALAGVTWGPVSLSFAEMSLNSNWLYQDSKTGSDQFRQNYAASASNSIEFTEIMDVDLSLRVDRSQTRTSRNDTISPGATYKLTNDLFSFNLSGHANEQRNSNSTDTSGKDMSAVWSSAWKTGGWIPALSMIHNKSWQEDDLNPHLSDSSSTGSTANLNWDLKHSKLYVNVGRQESSDAVSLAESLTTNRLVRFDTGAQFLDKKGSITFSSQYAYTESENSLAVSAGSGFLQLSITSSAGEIAAAVGTAFSLVAEGKFTNGVKTSETALQTDLVAGDFVTIAVKNSPNEQVHRIYLYTDGDIGSADAAKFSWDIYSSNDPNNWTLQATAAPFTYNSSSQRFEFTLAGYANDYVAIRATADASPVQIIFSEIEAYQQINASGDRAVVTSDQTVLKNDLDLTLQIKPDLQLTSNLSLQQSDYSSGSEMTNTVMSTSLNWDPKEYFNIRLSGSMVNLARTAALDEQDRSYALSVSYPPLPTLDTVYSVAVRESYRGSQKLSSTSSYNVSVAAEIYRDLDARLNTTFSENNNYEEGTQGSFVSSNLDLTARLVPGLVANVSGKYSSTSGQSGTFGGDLNLHWRVSELMSAHGGFKQTWASGGDASSLDLGVDIALSRNMQISLAHSFKIRPDSQHDTSLSWRWTISQYISLLTTGSFVTQDGTNEWSFASRLNASFSAL